MPRLFDSSGLVKRYHREGGTEHVEQLFGEPSDRLLVSRLALVELHSCFARLVREGVLKAADFGPLIDRLNADVASGTFKVAALSSQRLQDASSLLATQGFTMPIRTLDAIHLGPSAWHNGTRLAAFVAADKRLLASAAACRLSVLDVG